MDYIERHYKNISLTQFLEILDRDKFAWIVKRLSGNDTGITGGHQSGIYVSADFMKQAVPSVINTKVLNHTVEVSCYIPSHDCLKTGIQAKYYNNKFFPKLGLKKKYDEFRLTRWKQTPLQDVDNTGSICVLAGLYENDKTILLCWVAKSIEEENQIELWLGKEVEPGFIYNSQSAETTAATSLDQNLPDSWNKIFPSGKEIFQLVEERIPQKNWKGDVDNLILKRRKLEFEIFEEVEKREILPIIKEGFTSVSKFIHYANSIVNRRKSRAGTSLELHLESIFKYEGLNFETQVVTEQNKKPDFIFPSAADYHNINFPDNKLHMLASKTCCKDRWRQVINEADRIKHKHLFTLQEGVSVNQLDEIYQHGIILVVPEPTKKSFPAKYRQKIMNLTGFVDLIKHSQQPDI